MVNRIAGNSDMRIRSPTRFAGTFFGMVGKTLIQIRHANFALPGTRVVTALISV